MYLRVWDRVSDEDVISVALCGISMKTAGGVVKLLINFPTFRSAVVSFFKGGYREMKQQLYTGLFCNSICGN